MPLRVAFDLDGTVADMYSALRKEAVGLFGDGVLRTAPPTASAPQQAGPDQTSPAEGNDEATNPAIQELHLTARQQNQLWAHVKGIENFWTMLPEMEEGIIARIAKTAAERRWEVIFLTTRPATNGDLVQMQSQRWLAEKGFRYPSVFVVHRSRGRIADALALDAFVDDRPENCLDIAAESRAKVILVWPGKMSDVPAAITRIGVRAVATIGEAVTVLEELDDTRAKPGLLKSIKRAIGASQD